MGGDGVAALISTFFESLLLSCGPLIVLGVAVYFCRALFLFLLGREHGHRLQLAFLAPSTPLREVAHALSAILFFHSVTEVGFLNLHDPDGEIGFVEHSYHPRNPLAQLGNFVYALAPLALELFLVYLLLITCFGGVMTTLSAELAALTAAGSGIGAYLAVAFSLLPAMLRAAAPLWLKLLGFAALAFLCMGIFVSLNELIEGLLGFLIYAGAVLVFTAVLMLFDTRVQRILLGGLRSFATTVTALGVVVLTVVAALVALAALFFLFRVLFLTTPEGSGEALLLGQQNEKNSRMGRY